MAADGPVLVVAGAHVVPGHVDAVRRFAAATNLGVLNTFSAKGLFPWDSPFHLGTAGLQARDYELAGAFEAERVLAVGLDPLEALPVEVEAIAPDELDSWAARLGRAPEAPVRSRLYEALAAVVRPLYEVEGSPAWRARHLAIDCPPGGLVCADPGPTGFWIARTFPTTEPGSVYVPLAPGVGQAAARAEAARAEGRPVILVDEEWDIDPAHTQALVDVAGPISAWQ